MARKRQARRCSAWNRRGLPCGSYAVLGMPVCHMHGGASPRARDAARRRLRDAALWRFLATGCRDGRIGPQRTDGYGCLPPNRRECYLDDSRHLAWLRAEADPARRELRQALREMLRPDET